MEIEKIKIIRVRITGDRKDHKEELKAKNYIKKNKYKIVTSGIIMLDKDTPTDEFYIIADKEVIKK